MMTRKPKVGRGGPRSGTPGTAYPNRTDLQSPGNLPYGQAQQLQQSGAAMQSAAQAQVPPQAPPAPFNRPTERPNEPVTTGLPFGPGAGPEALGAPPGADVGSALRGLLLASNNPDVQALLAEWEMRQGAYAPTAPAATTQPPPRR